MSKQSRNSKFLRMLSFSFKLIFNRLHKIKIDYLPAGSILDVGGGGEGIIAQIGREGVTSIDKSQHEIDEAKHKAPEANWILADARTLDFPDEYFEVATAFFSIMYMSNDVKKEVFREIFRVLSQGAEFLVWDIPIKKETGVSLIKIKVIFPDNTKIRTAYGVSSKIQTSNSVKEMLQEVGFTVEILEEKRKWYLLLAKK
jgi:ubiquinone/menaquinone biosynthesis C-methylase UbiE